MRVTQPRLFEGRDHVLTAFHPPLREFLLGQVAILGLELAPGVDQGVHAGLTGLVPGLMLFGPRLIKTVGSEITELDKTRAFCIALSAAVTVILASQLGLPVSSTHIAIGGVFGVGFLREYLKSNYATQLHQIMEHHDPAEQERLRPFLDDFRNASVEEMENLLKQARKKKQVPLSKSERKRLKKIYREEMVKRSHLVRIAAAWIITVPASALMAAMLFFTLRGLMI